MLVSVSQYFLTPLIIILLLIKLLFAMILLFIESSVICEKVPLVVDMIGYNSDSFRTVGYVIVNFIVRIAFNFSH